MLDLQTFTTRKDTQAALSLLVGWFQPRVVNLYSPTHKHARKTGYIWALCARSIPSGRDLFLREDGYFR